MLLISSCTGITLPATVLNAAILKIQKYNVIAKDHNRLHILLVLQPTVTHSTVGGLVKIPHHTPVPMDVLDDLSR